MHRNIIHALLLISICGNCYPGSDAASHQQTGYSRWNTYTTALYKTAVAVPFIGACTYWLLSPSEETTSEVTPYVGAALSSFSSLIPSVAAVATQEYAHSNDHETSTDAPRTVKHSHIFDKLQRENRYMYQAQKHMCIADMDRNDDAWKKEMYQCHAPHRVSRATSRVIWDFDENDDEHAQVTPQEQAYVVSQVRKRLESQIKLFKPYFHNIDSLPVISSVYEGVPMVYVSFSDEGPEGGAAVTISSRNDKSIVFNTRFRNSYVNNADKAISSSRETAHESHIDKKGGVIEHEITHVLQYAIKDCEIGLLRLQSGKSFPSCISEDRKQYIPQSLYNSLYNAETEHELNKPEAMLWLAARTISPHAKRIAAKMHIHMFYWASQYFDDTTSLHVQRSIKSLKKDKGKNIPMDLDADLIMMANILSEEHYAYVMDQFATHIDDWMRQLMAQLARGEQEETYESETFRLLLNGYLSQLFTYVNDIGAAQL